MSGERDFLDKLAESVADGESIDWNELEKRVVDDKLRQLLRHLRVVAGVADVHRSQVDDVALVQDVVRTAATDDGTAIVSGQPAAPRIQATEDPSGPVQVDGIGRWGHLLLIRKIGEGAFGEVYHAHDTWLDHAVALKLLKPDVASRISHSKILHEARKLARVRHVNVVTVHGADRHEGRVGFWMDLIEGETLADFVHKGRMSAAEATHVGQEVCRALAAVHRANLVHRDVKAQNVMRAFDDGRIILMDFGAGEFLDQPSGARAQGTPLYLAPELFEGAPATVQTDIYAVGVLLYYLVTGRFPVEAGSIDALAAAHRQGHRRALGDHRPDLSESFVAVVEKTLRADPARRYGSAGELLAALAGEPSSQLREIRPAQSRTPAKASERTALQLVAPAGVVLALMLAAMAVLGFVAARAFEVVLRVDPEFFAGPMDYMRIGAQALLPFLVYWIVAAGVLGILAASRLLLGRRAEKMRSYWSRGRGTLDANALAIAVFVVGAAGWAAITWRYFDLFLALKELHQTPLTASVGGISFSSRTDHLAYGTYSAFLSFSLLWAAVRWLPRVERRCADPSTVRMMRWATLAMAFLVIAMVTVPRRILFERFEAVMFENRPALVIGVSGGELLLYDSARRTSVRIQRDAPTLRRTGATRQLFDR